MTVTKLNTLDCTINHTESKKLQNHRYKCPSSPVFLINPIKTQSLSEVIIRKGVRKTRKKGQREL